MVTKTLNQINEKIAEGNAVVITADEMPSIVEEYGIEKAVEEVDVVTTGTFGAMCSSGIWLNFGHTDPPIKIARAWLNDVEVYSGVAAVDAYLGATQPSTKLGIQYGGGHVIEDLLRGKNIHLNAIGSKTDCYSRENLETELTLSELNQAIMSNPRNCFERYNAATNTGKETLYTYMGKLLPENGNITYSGVGELSPINNDPKFQTIGIGTRIFLGGGTGYVIGNGTQHNPENHFSTLMVQGDLKGMSPEFVRGATFTGYGCTVYIGLGIPIPILNSSIAKYSGRSNKEITTNIVEYCISSRNRPSLKTVNYDELKTGIIDLNGKEVPATPISSFSKAKQIATILQKEIIGGKFIISQSVQSLPSEGKCNPMVEKVVTRSSPKKTTTSILSPVKTIRIDNNRCVNCGLCLAYCKSGVFTKNNQWEIQVNAKNCTFCYQCKNVCPLKAIKYE
ncbi:MAG: 4Fe-4S binding protein [Candidatus Heimdallarchaeota archaeon]|nr:4Fe-4S binding protein [Candidatus Heimdallarchaeota archaeon]